MAKYWLKLQYRDGLILQHTMAYKQPFRFLGGDSGGGAGVGGIRGLGSDIVFIHIPFILLVMPLRTPS